MPKVEPIDEKELFEMIAKGDRDSFRLFYDLYKKRIFAFAWQLCGSAPDAEEIVQDIFLKLWLRKETLSQVNSPRNYLFTMARNTVFTMLVKIAKNKELIEQSWANVTEFENYTDNILEAKESQILIEQAIGQLSLKKQTIFKMSRDLGLSHKEIAEQMGVSVQTVKNNLSESLNYIRLILSRHSELLSLIVWIHYYHLLC